MLIKSNKPKSSISYKINFKKYFKNILVTLNIVFLLIILIFLLYNISNKFKNIIDYRTNQISNFFIPKEYEFSFENVKNIFKYSISSNFSKVDNIEISINSNFKNTNEFYNQLKISNEIDNNKTYSKGSLLNNSETFKIKFRPKGDRKIHYKKDKPSFAVEILNGKSFLGMQKFSLQSPEIRNYLQELLWLELLNKSNIISPTYYFTDLVFNGESLGIYNYEEKPTTFMLERLGLKNSSILKFDETYGISLESNPEIKVINYSDVPLLNQNKATSILRNFIDGKATVKETFNIEKLVDFFVISNLMKTYHGLYVKSVRFYYNPFTNLLEPIPFDGHSGSEAFILVNELSEYPNLLNNEYLPSWLSLFFNEKNKDFISLYFEKLKYFSSEEYLNQIFNDEELMSKMENAKKIIYKNFPLEQGTLVPYFFDLKKFLNENASNIKNELNFQSNIQFYSKFTNNSIQINAVNFNNKVPVNIESLETKNYKLVIDKNINFWKDRISKNILSGTNINDSLIGDILVNQKLKINYSTYLGKKITRNVNLFDYNYNSGGLSNDYLGKLVKEKIISIKDDNIMFNNNKVVLNDLLIIPTNYKLILNSGQNIFFKSNSGIVLYGDLISNGSSVNPINFYGDKDNTNYSGYILGIGPSDIFMNYVSFFDFSSTNKLDIPGSVTFYNSNVKLKNVNFNTNSSEDYLNIVNSNFTMENIVFENCSSDCFDSDFSDGELNNVKFNISKNDGLDISESKINANNLFFKQIGDKAISAGENSKIYMNNININNSEIGIVSKDGSIIEGDNVIIDLVRLPLAIFKKKPRYNNPSISLSNYFNSNYDIKYLIEKPINIHINSKKIIGDKILVESLLYGNDYGIKTKK